MTEKKAKPQIRFAGFSDTWEQRKLGMCFSERIENMPNGELISVTINDGIKKFSELGRHDNSNDDKSKYKKVCIGDIAYNSMRMWQGASGYSSYEGIVSPAYTVLSPNEDIYSKCIAYQFKLPQMIHTFQINSQGITSDNWNLKYPTLSKIDIYISESIQEQKKIAEFFTHLDHLITLHQRKLDKLTNVKKSMLEKMFPKNGANVPEIRFKGFTDPWEQRKLGDIASDMVAGGDIDKDLILAEGQYPVIANALTGDGIVGYYDKEYRISAPAVTVTGRGDVGHAKARLVNFTPVVRLLAVKSAHDVFFLENAINTLKIVIESTGVPQLTVPQLAKYEVAFPRQLDEEKQIGAFFKHLDNLITLHQRKLEKLKNIKKACLEKMFI
ncbi:restriction endonuclease subunit S [Oscillospiraceae bacterium LCP25S3_E3]